MDRTRNLLLGQVKFMTQALNSRRLLIGPALPSASTTETKEAKKARREETVRRKAVQEEMGLIAMRVFEKPLARESDEVPSAASTAVASSSGLAAVGLTTCPPTRTASLLV